MAAMEKKNFNEPDKTDNIGRMKVEHITIASHEFTRYTAAPGWRWSTDIKPAAKTESCQINHLIYLVSGRIHTRMDDGSEMDLNPGDISSIPPGHDGWTVGDEPAVWFDLPH